MIATPISQIKLAPGSAMTIVGLIWKTYQALAQSFLVVFIFAINAATKSLNPRPLAEVGDLVVS